jgi:phage shock protein C
MVVFGGTGILLYIAAIIIIPKHPLIETEPVDQPAAEKANKSSQHWFGYLLIGGGVLLLLANLDLFHFFDFLGNTIEYIFPIILIVLGMAVIYYRQSKPSDVETEHTPSAGAAPSEQYSYRQFRRSISDRKIFGVCGGLASYFGIDPSLMRLLYVILCIASFGAGLILYLLLAIVIPDDSTVHTRA